MLPRIPSSTKYVKVIFQWPSGPYNKNPSLPNLSQYSNMTGRGGRRHKQLLGDLNGKERILEIEIGRTRTHRVQNWPWKRLWVCRKTDYWIHSLHIQSSSRNRQILGSSKLASKTNSGNAPGQQMTLANTVVRRNAFAWDKILARPYLHYLEWSVAAGKGLNSGASNNGWTNMPDWFEWQRTEKIEILGENPVPKSLFPATNRTLQVTGLNPILRGEKLVIRRLNYGTAVSFFTSTHL